LKSFSLNGKIIQFKQVLNHESLLEDFSAFELDTLSFIKDWLTKKAQFAVKTSGSTGTPKTLIFERKQLLGSAQRTIETFGLKKGDRTLICLNPNFIAGKMMLVRGIEAELKMDIIEPSSNPLEKIDPEKQFEFVALFTNQIEKALQKTPEKLDSIKTVLVGGATVFPTLESDLQKVKSQIYHSYATTETLSHLALRCVNGNKKSEIYQAMNGVSFDIDNRSCLVINDTLLGIRRLATNDIVELIDPNSFRWKGRIDNVVNSGGIKIHLEETEELIRQILLDNSIRENFCLVPKPDRALSQILVLLLESSKDETQAAQLLKLIRKEMPKYQAPREIVFVPKLHMTMTGKIDRIKNASVYIKKEIK
jgi:O-succinylbenzoic acid--CoA ligase